MLSNLIMYGPKSLSSKEMVASLELNDWHLVARARHAWRNIMGMSLLALFHALLSWWYDDMVMGSLFGIIGCAGTLMFFSMRSDSLEGRYIIPQSMGVLFMWLVQVYGPEGMPGALLIFPFSLAVITSVPHFSQGLFIVGLVVLPRMLALHMGWTHQQSDAVPAFVSVLLTSGYCLAAVQMGLIGFRSGTRMARASIAENISKINLKHAILSERRTELEEANRKFSRQTHHFQVQIQREKAIAHTLKQKLSDEHDILRAIDADLRNPAESAKAALSKIAAQLESESREKGMGEYLDFASGAAVRLLRMLEQIEHYIGYGGNLPPRQTYPLDEVLQKAWQDACLAELPGQPVLPLSSSLPNGIWVRGREQALSRLLQEVFSNAIRFRKENLSPKVEADYAFLPDASLEIRISDQGIGLPDGQIYRVWGLFNRLHEHLGYSGDGIGLTLARKLALLEGLQLSLTTNQAAGITARLHFPDHVLLIGTHNPFLPSEEMDLTLTEATRQVQVDPINA